MNDDGGGGGQFLVEGGFLGVGGGGGGDGDGGGGGGLWLHGLLQAGQEPHLMPESGDVGTVVSSSFLVIKQLIGVVIVVIMKNIIRRFMGLNLWVVIDILSFVERNLIG
ncbi:hypothetical protein CsSME_00022552 [Camellia sinensis var. sinensis]